MEKLVAEILPNQPFSYKATLFAHGWADLEPFELDPDQRTLNYSILLASKRAVHFKIFEKDDILIQIRNNEQLNQNESENISQIVRYIFRLDEDLSQFYKLAGKDPEYQWIAKKKAGRLLRAGSVWEDMVKILCTTNCSWHLTKLMIRNMVQKIGHGTHFPVPEEIAATDEIFLRKEIKMGYRAPFLLELAQNVKSGSLDLTKWTNWSGTSEELFKEIRKIKGLGEYAVSSLLKLLGRYDFLGIDSWGRRTFADRYNSGKIADDKTIKLRYEKYGQWAGLFYWLDLTRDLYSG